MTYAETKGCEEAFLIYPIPLPIPYDGIFGDIRVKSMFFSLSGNLKEAGQMFMKTLLENTNLQIN